MVITKGRILVPFYREIFPFLFFWKSLIVVYVCLFFLCVLCTLSLCVRGYFDFFLMVFGFVCYKREREEEKKRKMKENERKENASRSPDTPIMHVRSLVKRSDYLGI